MIVIRPIARRDLDTYITLSLGSQINMLSMPKDVGLLEHQLDKSVDSFRDGVEVPDKESYLFVAEDTESHELVGVSGITATTGGNEPLYFYRIEYIDVVSNIEAVIKRIPVLNPVSYVRGPSEIGSLFVAPEFRSLGIGKLLSFSRFLFVARFPQRFTGSIITELRGKVEDDKCPFWDIVGRKFFNKSATEVVEMLKYGRSFVGHFLPKYPIYIDLLPYSVQQIIGQPDTHTLGAYSLLKRLGFKPSGDVDVVDAGPKMYALKENIVAITHSERLMVTDLFEANAKEKGFIIANERLDFRACYGQVRKEGEKVLISSEVACQLEVGVGDYIRILDLGAA